MKTILFFTDVHTGTHHDKLEGVYERAHLYGWHIIEIEYENSLRSIDDYLKTWHPDGCIVICAALTEPIDSNRFHAIPTVYLDPDEKTLASGCPCVCSAPEPLARLAAQELTALHCASYAYVGWNKRTAWSEGRRMAFEHLMQEQKLPVFSFAEQCPLRDKILLVEQLSSWLEKLPKPCGIFAANDNIACQIADICRQVGLGIPSDVAIVGVDNQEILCENAVTSLSSIEIDFRESGRLAADALAGLLSKPDIPQHNFFFGPQRLVRRQSTRRLQHGSPIIERALERIRREACLGLTAADIIADMKLPRRAAERLFRKSTGTSILSEINRYRLEHAFTLLRKPNYPIFLIAQQCGWTNDVFLKRLFKRTTGMTMREYKKKSDSR
ncbi:MAG: substrate-binding domain-containing protein [Kiritimatiellia bacterium]